MQLISRVSLALGLTVGMVATAQAASFNCAYTLDDGGFGVYPVEAVDGTDATNQAIALIRRDHPAAGFTVQCHEG
ncbi:hypothetical protein KQ945_09350 [Bacillus subtilis subsp. subtilis]|nr:hypothetical protein [Bacillus subtilis subsp. subtilis]